MITTIPAINFNEETEEYKNANYPDSSEAATQKVDRYGFSQLETDVRWQSAQQLKTAEMSFDAQKTSTVTKEDLEQNSTDIPVAMQRQVLVIQSTDNGGCPTGSVH